VSWAGLVAFAQAEAPSFFASLKGVSPVVIAAVEQEYGVRLPDSYRQFLLLMGDDSAGFHLFGSGQNQRFADVVARLPEQSSAVQEFFNIAFADDPSMVSPPDHFLDLTRSDGLDAPIVLFEGGDDFNREDVREKGFTFLEQAYRRIFSYLADQRLTERALFAISNPPPDRSTLSISVVVSALERMHFAVAVQPLARVTCMRRADAWALVDEHLGGRGFAISLWSSDRSAVDVIVDQLLLSFPHATANYRPRPPTV
jgi:hypothetical protein